MDLGMLGYEVSTEVRQSQRKVQKVAEYISNNIQGPILVEDLAVMTGFSERYFRRMFKNVTGQSIGAYIQDQRLFQALKILRNSKDGSILDTALEVGYESHSAFTRSFKQRLGFSPSSFKQSPFQVRLHYHQKVSHSRSTTIPLRLVNVAEWTVIGRICRDLRQLEVNKRRLHEDIDRYLLTTRQHTTKLCDVCTIFEDPRQNLPEDVRYFVGYLINPWQVPSIDHDRFYVCQYGGGLCAVFEHIGEPSMLWQLAIRGFHLIEAEPHYRYSFEHFHYLHNILPGHTRVYIPVLKN